MRYTGGWLNKLMMLNQFNDVREGLLEVVRGALMETDLLMRCLEVLDGRCEFAKITQTGKFSVGRGDD